MEELMKLIETNLPQIISFGLNVVFAFVAFFIGKYIIKWIRKFVKKGLERSNADAGAIQFIDSFLKATLFMLLLVIIAAQFGLQPTSIAALLASAGVAIGLALQGSLSNLAGGVLILLLKPFVVGDYIIEDNNKNEGTVHEIQIFYTKLKTVDNKIIILPNGSLANNSLTNMTNQEHRRLDLKIDIAYDADLKKAKEVLMSLIMDNDKILKDHDIFVVIEELAESSVVIGCKTWVKTEDYWQVKWDMLEIIKLTFDEEGIEIPYNHMTVEIKKEM